MKVARTLRSYQALAIGMMIAQANFETCVAIVSFFSW